jgi:hypothetical protein
LTSARITGVQGTPATIPAGVVVPSSSGLSPAEFFDVVYPDALLTVTTFGLPTAEFCTYTGPPSWLGTGGQILEPGVYATYLGVETTTTGTAGEYLSVGGNESGPGCVMVPIDAIAHGPHPYPYPVSIGPFTFSVDASDVPQSATVFFTTPSDASTWGLKAGTIYQRLAYAT